MAVKRLTIIAVLITILFVQEELLLGIAGVQLTFFLIVLYAKKLKLYESIIIVVIHTFLDNLFMGSLYLFPVMLVSLLIIPLGINLFFKKCENAALLAIMGSLFALLYCFNFAIYNFLVMKVDLKAYIIADIPFTLILMAVSGLSILWLYSKVGQPLNNLLQKYERK